MERTCVPFSHALQIAMLQFDARNIRAFSDEPH